MAAPILKIPVDDDAFKRFLKTWQKYQGQLEDQPELWSDIGTEMRGAALAGAALADALQAQAQAQEELQERRKQALRDQQEEARARSDAARSEEEKEERRARRRREAVQDIKNYARSAGEVAVNLGKWALGGGALAAVGTGVSLWGLDKIFSGVADERRMAQGLGVSIGQRQYGASNLQRYFDVNSTMEKVANMQGDPTQWAPFAMMGVNPRGKNPAQLLQEVTVAARSMFIKDKGNLALAQAQGLTDIFGADDLRRLAVTPAGDLHTSMATANKLAANQGLSDAVGKKWQDLSVTLDNLKLKIENVLIDGLARLDKGGELEKLADAFSNFASAVLTPKLFDQLGDALNTFTKYVTGPDFAPSVKAFTEDVVTLAKAIDDALHFLTPSTPAPGSREARDGTVMDLGPFGSVKLSDSKYKRTVSEKDAFNLVNTQLAGYGWSSAQRAGLLSSAHFESGFDPMLWGDYDKHGVPQAYGLMQWNKDRRDQYLRIFHHSMESVKDFKQALSEQTFFENWELNHSEKAAGAALRRAGTQFTAGEIVTLEYERPAHSIARSLVRGAYSAGLTVPTVVVKNQTGASVATTSSAAAGGGTGK